MDHPKCRLVMECASPLVPSSGVASIQSARRCSMLEGPAGRKQRASGSASPHIFRPVRVNPKGIPSFSPGLRGTSYPGLVVAEFLNPEGVAAVVLTTGARRCNPFRVDGNAAGASPRVGPPAPFPRRSNPGLKDAIPSGLAEPTGEEAGNGKPLARTFHNHRRRVGARGVPRQGWAFVGRVPPRGGMSAIPSRCERCRLGGRGEGHGLNRKPTLPWNNQTAPCD